MTITVPTALLMIPIMAIIVGWHLVGIRLMSLVWNRDFREHPRHGALTRAGWCFGWPWLWPIFVAICLYLIITDGDRQPGKIATALAGKDRWRDAD